MTDYSCAKLNVSLFGGMKQEGVCLIGESSLLTLRGAAFSKSNLLTGLLNSVTMGPL